MKRFCSGLVLAIVLAPTLQGCFPLVATGMVGTGFVIADRRTSGAQLEDEGIELRADHDIGEKFGDKVHVNVTSFNRNLLLTGEVPDQSTRNSLEALARRVTNVRSVINETIIAGNSSLSQRTTDSYVSTKVHARLVSEAQDRYSPVQISVTTEDGIVYLMGLVTHAEGDAAASVASTTSGVRKVVKVFEYLAKAPESERVAAQQDNASAPAPSRPAEVQPPAPQSEDSLPPAQPVHL
ncbi:MAG: BON domain-containing protein [Betaproteobacteria bacterium]|nr:BON domain-containing protein [Betaproteobacteria bacterium]MDE2621605.1 BON domain-containing protein [Betaproteobacteria bacterium]